jgi:hypothetical protein
VPSCGVDPIVVGASLMMLPATVAAFGVDVGAASHWSVTSPHYLAATLGISVALSLAFGWLYNQPHRVSSLWQRFGCGDFGAARAQLRLAGIRSALFVAAVVLGGALAAQLGRGRVALEVTGLILGTGVLLDLIDEWRARNHQADLKSVWPVHRVYAVGPAVDALRAADITVVVRGMHHRTLLQFFGAFVPVDLLVPHHQAERALALLSPLLSPHRGDTGPASTDAA